MVGMYDDEWTDRGVEDVDDEAFETPFRRRRIAIVVAALVALAMAAVPLWNVIDRGAPPVADSGLEICGWDYCRVQDRIRGIGLGEEMSALAHTFLTDGEAEAYAHDLVEWLGQDPVRVRIVDRLDGRIAGQFSSSTRTIRLERPVRAWIVVHEVAHTVAGGHAESFVEALRSLVESGLRPGG